MTAVKHILYLATVLFALFSCANKQETVEQETDLITITNQQFTTDSMQLGEMERITFENTVKCNGTIIPLPNGMTSVNALISGVIKHINCHNGQFVTKNQVLMEVSGNEVIDIQKDFAEASAIYHRLKKDYERATSLFDEKVTSEKEFIIAESEYKTSIARYSGLKMKVEALGFSASKIENGEFYTAYPIQSPINGYVSKLKAHAGSYIDQQSALIDITDPSKFQVQLAVFPSDVSRLKKGQTVRFTPINGGNTFLATLTSIGVALNNDSKSIDCYASITGTNTTNAIANEFVESEIVTGTDTVYALPDNAIIKAETAHYILVLNKKEEGLYLFDKVAVNIGRQYKGYSEILNGKIDGKIIVKGLYNISL